MKYHKTKARATRNKLVDFGFGGGGVWGRGGWGKMEKLSIRICSVFVEDCCQQLESKKKKKFMSGKVTVD